MHVRAWKSKAGRKRVFSEMTNVLVRQLKKKRAKSIILGVDTHKLQTNVFIDDKSEHFHTRAAAAACAMAGFFCAHHFCPKWKIVTFFSSSLPRFDKCHEPSRIFPRTEQTFASARSFGVIS